MISFLVYLAPIQNARSFGVVLDWGRMVTGIGARKPTSLDVG